MILKEISGLFGENWNLLPLREPHRGLGSAAESQQRTVPTQVQWCLLRCSGEHSVICRTLLVLRQLLTRYYSPNQFFLSQRGYILCGIGASVVTDGE